MRNSFRHPAVTILLAASAALVLLGACGDDDDEGEGIQLSETDSTAEDGTATATSTATASSTEVSGTTIVGTVPLEETSLVDDFNELREVIEDDLDPSPLADEEDLDELLSDCAGEDEGTATPEEDESEARPTQLDGCVALLDLLSSKEEPALDPLIDLVLDFALQEFPDDADEINEAAGRATPTPTP